MRARELLRQIAAATWECADPGMQFDTTINRWHTAANTGRINGTNPCSEYVHLDNSACNLASLNLLTFLDDGDDHFDVDGFRRAVEVVFTAQEILVGNADYPTEIGETTRRVPPARSGLRQPRRPADGARPAVRLRRRPGVGRRDHRADDRPRLRHVGPHCAAAWAPSPGSPTTASTCSMCCDMHREAAAQIDEELVPADAASAAQQAWDEAVASWREVGVRNSQATVLAPTGTIGFMMDCDTTGIEPDLGLVKIKKLVGGGTMSIVNQTVPRALRRLGYTLAADRRRSSPTSTSTSRSSAHPHLRPEHLPVFACSMGDNVIHYVGHVRMMAAVQPFISGAISKT